MPWPDSDAKRFRRAKYADWFACFDRNGNGVLDRSDFAAYAGAITEQLGLIDDDDQDALVRLHGASDALWTAVVTSMDPDGDGEVRLRDCVDRFATLADEVAYSGRVPKWAQDLVVATFEALDVDGDGAIRVGEYAAYLEAIGSDASPSAAFAVLDVDQDGLLTLAEVRARYAEWLSSDAPSTPGNLLLTGRLPETEPG